MIPFVTRLDVPRRFHIFGPAMRAADACEQAGRPGAVHAAASFLSALFPAGPAEGAPHCGSVSTDVTLTSGWIKRSLRGLGAARTGSRKSAATAAEKYNGSAKMALGNSEGPGSGESIRPVGVPQGTPRTRRTSHHEGLRPRQLGDSEGPISEQAGGKGVGWPAAELSSNRMPGDTGLPSAPSAGMGASEAGSTLMLCPDPELGGDPGRLPARSRWAAGTQPGDPLGRCDLTRVPSSTRLLGWNAFPWAADSGAGAGHGAIRSASTPCMPETAAGPWPESPDDASGPSGSAPAADEHGDKALRRPDGRAGGQPGGFAPKLDEESWVLFRRPGPAGAALGAGGAGAAQV
jgi:hypothetical protein